MDKFRIVGGRRLEGRVQVSGAKNSALPCMAAALLTPETVTLHNLPYVRDIITMRRLLEDLGCTILMPELRTLKINAANVEIYEAPYELVKTMRASVLTLGPLVARFGYARVSLPGGCAIGARPIDLHLKALEKLGASIRTEHGYVEARVSDSGRLRGAHILFDKITVTGTENILMAATLAEGETLIENAAREPEVVDLAALLVKMGAQIEGAGTSEIRVRGVSALHGASHAIIPDRIEAGTYLVAGALTGGELRLTACEPAHLTAVVNKLRDTGVEIHCEGQNCLRVRGRRRLRACDLKTEEYPGFPTDMQAQYMVLATQAEGSTVITETIFENRFLHALELVRMGANITLEGRQAVVRGPTALSGATVIASDLRASASLVLAGLVASGETLVDRVYHLDRGYEQMAEKLSAVGARIQRIR